MTPTPSNFLAALVRLTIRALPDPDAPANVRLTRIIRPHRREKRTNKLKLRPLSHKACVLTGSRRGEAACEAMGASLDQLARLGETDLHGASNGGNSWSVSSPAAVGGM